MPFVLTRNRPENITAACLPKDLADKVRANQTGFFIFVLSGLGLIMPAGKFSDARELSVLTNFIPSFSIPRATIARPRPPARPGSYFRPLSLLVKLPSSPALYR